MMYNKAKFIIPSQDGKKRRFIMKKIIAMILLLAFAAVMFSGCASELITVGTGGPTGTYYGYTNAVGTILGTETGLNFNVVSTGGSVANIKGMDDGDYKMAIVQNDTMIKAYNALDDKNFANGAITSFSVLGEVYSEVVQIVVDGKLKDQVKTLADLKGMRVSVGDIGSGVLDNAKQLFAMYGIDIDKDIQQFNLSVGDSASQMKDEKIDAFFFTSGAPATAITDLALSKDIFLLSLEDSVMEKFIENNKIDGKYEVYSKQPITHAQYACIAEDAPVYTIGVTATFIVSNNLSEDTVYSITKALWEKKADIAQAHAIGASMDVNSAFVTIGNVPLHKGAEKYYKEIGLID